MPTSSSAATSSSSAMGSRAPLKSVDEKGVSFQFRVGGACWQATIMHRNTHERMKAARASSPASSASSTSSMDLK